MKGMCQNASRSLQFYSAKEANLNPLLFSTLLSEVGNVALDVIIHVQYITKQEDYQIFDALKSNFSRVLDLIDEQKGVNAMDEWGQTPLMIAVSNNNMSPIFAALMNARRPKVDVNIAKPVC